MIEKNIDLEIEELLEIVKNEKEEVDHIEKGISKGWKTNCSFKIYGSQPVNITIANEDLVLKVFTELLILKDYTTQATKILGLDKEGRHDGYLIKDWIEDLQKRNAIIQLKILIIRTIQIKSL